eukprot:Lithocolla_globosa_v1_NODE_6912_length_1016_cov_155.696150.p1 type:complete len:283 gc:universal NODE_6912_length_1016_cov_155.696150:52-900(+)
MAPVQYKDVGKSAADLLSKDMPSGSLKVELKTKTHSGLSFASKIERKGDAVSHEVKETYKDKEYKSEVITSYNSKNEVKIETNMDDAFTVDGLKLTGDGTYSPAKSSGDLNLGLRYKQENVNIGTSCSLFGGPVVSSDLVVGKDGFIAGANVSAGLAKGFALKNLDLGVGYSDKSYGINLFARKTLSVFHGSYYYKASKNTEVSCSANFEKEKNKLGLEIAGKYKVDKDSSIKAKLTSTFQVAVGYTQVLCPGITANLGALFNASKFSEQDLKFGVNLNFDA